jgi:hypothetical protein
VAREQRKLAAILAADVVGYSRLMGARRERHAGGHEGATIVKTTGLATMMGFDGSLSSSKMLGLFALLRGGSNLARRLAGLGEIAQG